MADNTTITPGSGATIAADDISSVLYQRGKITLGADGVNDGDVSDSNPMPVKQSDGDAAFYNGISSVAYNSISSTYNAMIDLTGYKIRKIEVTNDTDAGVFLSWNGGVNSFRIIMPGQTKSYSVGETGLHITGGVIGVKTAAGFSDPTEGYLHIETVRAS